MKKQDKKMASWQAMKQLLPIIGRYRLLLFISIILAAVSVISQLYVPITFGRAIDQIVGVGQRGLDDIGIDGAVAVAIGNLPDLGLAGAFDQVIKGGVRHGSLGLGVGWPGRVRIPPRPAPDAARQG